MDGTYIGTMQMINILDIQSEKAYDIVYKSYNLLSSKSLKYICKTDDFDEIIRKAQKYWKLGNQEGILPGFLKVFFY